MSDVNANINIDIDSSGALAQLRQLQSAISNFNKSVITSNSAAVAAQQSVISNLQAQIGATQQFSTSIGQTETSVSRLQKSIDKNKLSLGQYFRYGVASSQTFGRVFKREHTELFDLATERVKRLQTQYIALGAAQNGVMKTMAVRPLNLFNADAEIGIQRQQLFNKLLHDGSTSLINFGKNTQWAGRQLMVGFTVPLTIFGGMAGKIFMDLEQQVVKFRRVYGDATTPRSETDAMIGQIQELGKEYTKYGIAVKDTVALAADAAAAGAQGADLVAATAQATRLATLGMIDQQQALTATISLQNAFRLSTDELAQSVDFLNAVENQTVVSLDDVTQAIPKVAPVIQGLGGNVQDLAMFLAAMREGGVNAAEGANALKSGLASLINPTNAAQDVLKKVGINLKEIVSTNKGDLRGIVMEFGAALGTLDKFQRQQVLAKMFGKYQFARLGALFDNINKKGSQAQRVLELTGQSAGEMANLAEKELGAIEQSVGVKFTAAIEKLKLAIAPIGETFLKIATPIIEVVGKLLEKFNELSPGIKQFITILVGGLGVVVPTIIMLIGLFANFAGNAIKGISLMKGFFSRLKGGGGALRYLAEAELDATAAAASLEGATDSLTQSFNAQYGAARRLIGIYEGVAAAANAAASNMPTGFRVPIIGTGGTAGRPVPGRVPRRMATGGMVGGRGNKDTEPALLTPGEFVMNKDATQKFGPVLDAMNRGNVSMLQGGSRANTKVPIYGETALRMQSGSENVARRASALIVEEVLSILSLRVGEARGMVPSQSQVAKGRFDPVAKELTPITKQFVDRVNAHFNDTFKDIQNSDERMTAAWRRAGQDMSSTVAKLSEIDRQVVERYMGLSEDVYATIPTDVRKQGDAQLTRARSGAYKRSAGLARSYTSIRGAARSMYGRLTGTSGEGMTVGHVFKPREIDLSELEKDPNASAAVTRAMKNLGKVGSDAMSETIAKEDPTQKGLSSEAGRNSPHRQATENAREDGAAYAKTYAASVDDGLAASQSRGAVILGQGGTQQTPPIDVEGSKEVKDSVKQQVDANKRDAAETNKKASIMSRFGKSLMSGSGKMQGLLFGLDSVVLGLSFLDNGIGQFAQKIMPAVFAVQGLTMVLPMLTNPVGLFAVSLAAVAGSMWFFKSKADEMAENARQMSESLIASTDTVNKIAEFYGTKSLVEKQQIKESAARAGVSRPQIEKAQSFVESEIGLQLQNGLAEAFNLLGKDAATKQFATNLSSMVLQGVINPKQASAIAEVMGQRLQDKTFSIQVDGQLKQLLGPNNENLLENPLRLALEIDRQNVQTVQSLTQNVDALSGRMQEFSKGTLGDVGAMFIPVFGQINMINKLTLGMDNWFGQISRSARGILNPDDFEVVNQQLQEIGNVVGNQLVQSFDNLSAAKQRYLTISEEAAKIDKKDVNAKAEAEAAARRAKRSQDILTESINNQKKSYQDMFSSLDQAARTPVLEGMRTSLEGMFKDNPAMKMAYDAIKGDLQKVGPSTEFRINMELQSKQLSPSTLQNFANSLYAGNIQQATVHTLDLIADFKGDTQSVNMFLQSMFSSGLDQQTQLDLILNVQENMSLEQLQAYSGVISELGLVENADLKKSIAITATGASVEDMKNIESGLRILNGLPPNLRKRIEVSADTTTIQNFGEWYSKIQESPASVTKLLKAKDKYSAAFEAFGTNYDKFNALPNINKAMVMTYMTSFLSLQKQYEDVDQMIQDKGKLDAEGIPVQGKGLYKQLGTTAGKISDITDLGKAAGKKGTKAPEVKTPGGGGNGDGGGGGGGGSKDASAYKQYLKDLLTQINLTRDAGATLNNVMNKIKSGNLKFKGIMDQLRAAGLPEDMIQDWASKGAEGIKLANKALDKRGKNLTDFGRKAKKMYLAASVGEILQANKETARKNAYKQKVTAQLDSALGAGMSPAVRDAILSDEKTVEALANVNTNTEKGRKIWDKIVKSITNAVSATDQQISAQERLNEIASQQTDILNHDLTIMAEQEEKVRTAYQKRIEALDEVAKLNDYIINQQKSQIGLADALSRGDISTAAVTAQEMRGATATYAMEQMRTGLESGMQNLIENLTNQYGETREQIQDRINALAEETYQRNLLITSLKNTDLGILPGQVNPYGVGAAAAAAAVPTYSTGTSGATVDVSSAGAAGKKGSVYNNSYDVTVNVSGTNVSPDAIADKVIAKIKNMNNSGVRGHRGNR